MGSVSTVERTPESSDFLLQRLRAYSVPNRRQGTADELHSAIRAVPHVTSLRRRLIHVLQKQFRKVGAPHFWRDIGRPSQQRQQNHRDGDGLRCAAITSTRHVIRLRHEAASGPHGPCRHGPSGRPDWVALAAKLFLRTASRLPGMMTGGAGVSKDSTSVDERPLRRLRGPRLLKHPLEHRQFLVGQQLVGHRRAGASRSGPRRRSASQSCRGPGRRPSVSMLRMRPFASTRTRLTTLAWSAGHSLTGRSVPSAAKNGVSEAKPTRRSSSSAASTVRSTRRQRASNSALIASATAGLRVKCPAICIALRLR